MPAPADPGSPVAASPDPASPVAASRLSGSRVPNTNAAFDEQLTLGQRAADRVASFGGSWTFVLLFVAVLVAWMVGNAAVLPRGERFDPYPFILLNLVLSAVAALQAPVIMMSQNRQSFKDRLAAEHDYAVNVRAEAEIHALHERLDALQATYDALLDSHARLHDRHETLLRSVLQRLP